MAAALLLGSIGVVNAGPVGVAGGVTGSAGVGGLGLGASAGGAFGNNASAAGALHGGAASAAGGANAAVGAAAPGAPDLRVNTSDWETIGMRQDRLTTQASNAGGRALEAPGMTVANDHALVAVANAGPTPKALRDGGFDDRAQIESQVDARMDATAKAVAALKHETKTLNADQRAEFRTAVKDLDRKEAALKKSLKAARKATADNWASARSDVAANYDAYAEAAQHAESVVAAAHTSTSADVTSTTTGAAAVSK